MSHHEEKDYNRQNANSANDKAKARQNEVPGKQNQNQNQNQQPRVAGRDQQEKGREAAPANVRSENERNLDR